MSWVGVILLVFGNVPNEGDFFSGRGKNLLLTYFCDIYI